MTSRTVRWSELYLRLQHHDWCKVQQCQRRVRGMNERGRLPKRGWFCFCPVGFGWCIFDVHRDCGNVYRSRELGRWTGLHCSRFCILECCHAWHRGGGWSVTVIAVCRNNESSPREEALVTTVTGGLVKGSAVQSDFTHQVLLIAASRRNFNEGPVASFNLW